MERIEYPKSSNIQQQEDIALYKKKKIRPNKKINFELRNFDPVKLSPEKIQFTDSEDMDQNKRNYYHLFL